MMEMPLPTMAAIKANINVMPDAQLVLMVNVHFATQLMAGF